MAKITNITARIIKNSRDEETIEVVVSANNDMSANASVPAGKSKGAAEAVSLPAPEAKISIEQRIAPALLDLNPENQKVIDEKIISLDGSENKSNLGGNAMLAVSLAVARVGAKTKNIPLWRHIEELFGGKSPKRSPRLLMNLINGGLHAKNNLDFQEYMIIPNSSSAQESLEIGEKIYKELLSLYPKASLGNEGGIASDFKNNDAPLKILTETAEKLGFLGKIELGIDAAASNVPKNTSDLTKEYLNLLEAHPNLIYIEDPLPENDFEGFALLRGKVGTKVIITGDDLTVTNVKRIEKAVENNSINGIIIKPNQIGTLSETLAAIKKAKENNWKIIIANRSGETEDDFIADLAFAVGAWGLKSGAPGPKERLQKYLRLKEIEGKEAK